MRPPDDATATSATTATMTLADAESWRVRAVKAFVWARLLVEIPKQVDARILKAREDLRELVEIRRFFPDGRATLEREGKAVQACELRCEVVPLDPSNRWACTMVRIERRTRDDREVAVEFAYTRDGHIKVHSVNLTNPSAPTVLGLPEHLGSVTISRTKGIAFIMAARAIDALDAQE